MEKRCVLYENRICNDCGECNRCDIDPSKICDNCGKCIDGGADVEFRSMLIKKSPDQAPNASDGTNAEDAEIDEFLNEPLDFETPEEIPVDPELLLQWENILKESFKNDPVNAEDDDEPILRAVRKRRARDMKHDEK